MKNPLLLFHGGLGSRTELFQLQEVLSKKREVYTMDFEGHGSSNMDRPFSINRFVENVKSFISDKNLSQLDVFGYSMGGYMVLVLASSHLSIVGRIITLGTKFSWRPNSATAELKKLDPRVIQEKVPTFAP